MSICMGILLPTENIQAIYNDKVHCDIHIYVEYNHNSMLSIHVVSSNHLYVYKYMLGKDSVQLVGYTSLFKDAAAAAASATSWHHIGFALNWTVSTVAQNTQ